MKKNFMKGLAGIVLLGSLAGCGEYSRRIPKMNDSVRYDPEVEIAPDDMGNLPVSIGSDPRYAGSVVDLDSSNFRGFTEEGSNVVLFYTSWDPASKKMQDHFSLVASEMPYANLGRMNFNQEEEDDGELL